MRAGVWEEHQNKLERKEIQMDTANEGYCSTILFCLIINEQDIKDNVHKPLALEIEQQNV